ncbi:MAG: STAS domain-containing protein [Gemmataceae bacterium]|nr:STAS domain-containing protein [Gemmataceae bacterium]
MSEPRTSRVQCPVLVLRLYDAQLAADTHMEELRDELLDRHRESEAANVVLDLEAVTYLSSAGITPLLMLVKAVRAGEGRLVLANLSPEVQGVLVATRLVSTAKGTPASLETQPDVPAAVASLYGK